MEKIDNYCINTIDKKQVSSTYYRIHISPKDNGFQARTSLNLFEAGENPRVSARGSNKEKACIKLLDNIKIKLLPYIYGGYVASNKLFELFDNISISIKEEGLDTNYVMTHFYNLISYVHSLVENVDDGSTKLISSDSKIKNSNIYVLPENKQIQNNTLKRIKKPFNEVAIEWFKYKYSFTKRTEENQKPLSRKTLDGYNKSIRLIINPFFENNKDIDTLTNDDFKECINNTNGSRNKESIYIVLKMILDYARKENYLSYARTIEKPKKSLKKSVIKIEGHELVYIESSRQEHWLDCLEEKGTDVTLLFETMLLEGLRPEEACGLTWDSFVDDFSYIFLRNAYKDFPIYNDDCEIIGHIREYDYLKTEESYRKIPVHPRLKEKLKEHKEKQIKLFKKYKLHWSESTACFLNKYRKPYVSENLSKAMKSFRDEFDLEYLTPYGLRHSFATFMSEQGMDDIVLMKIMGHSDFRTTQKYYIFVSDERKKQQYEQAWMINNKQKDDVEKNEKVENILKQPILITSIDEIRELWKYYNLEAKEA